MAAVRDLYEVLGRRARRDRRRHQEGLPEARARAPPRRERRRGGRGAVQGGRRAPTRSCPIPRSARRYDAFGDRRAARRGRRSPISRTSSTCSSARAGSGASAARAGAVRARARHGEDLGVRIVLGFRDAVFGARADLEIERLVDLRTVPGQRRRAGHRAGRVSHVRRGRPGPSRAAQRLRHGDDRRARAGRAEAPVRRCSTRARPASVEGRRREHATVTIDIPAGVSDGMELRVAGNGHAGVAGGPPGDLYVGSRSSPPRSSTAAARICSRCSTSR